MKARRKFVTFGTMLCVIVLFIGLDVQTGCACIDKDEEVLRESRYLVTETKKNRGTYPTYDEVSGAVQFGTVHKYEDARPETGGIYYASNPSRDEFVLKRYATVSLFGIKMPFLWEVR